MSDEAPEKSSKTEDPSQRKLDEAHKKGDVAKSQEVTTWFMLAGSGLLFAVLAPGTSVGLSQNLALVMANADQFEIGGPAFGALMAGMAGSVMLLALLPLCALAVFAIAANLVQHKPLLSVEPIKPKLSKISPIAGFKRLFSTEALVNFGKGLLKLAIVGAVLFFVLWPERDSLEVMVTSDPAAILLIFQNLGIKVFAAVIAVLTFIAIADFLYQRHRWWERQKMTVQETRDEYKQMEGDPQIKGRIRAIRNERSRKRMMANVPGATVIITNPTHYAVALKYDRDMAAPVCLAKGVDAVALRIRALAEEHSVPIVENPPLARALFASVDIDETIPAEHFKAVAQVIGYVMRLRKPAWRG
ncbi:flagellar biosynthesis protein FlhB [Arsenicitalea aurantiaca]|uniref:Flagellar biosynthetic protein FlhB n=1 Tax=Arsenicitalea aurantiaca TaxID=1783274 RepID=A0A433XGE6_9HYPH|nr:flagellar biosynthesis protein FlhB [Arsenicitalea aurantiaca]RUT33112.1 flagellar biosynthesis protein FlhB [Arsenicitalea aurantiaca]